MSDIYSDDLFLSKYFKAQYITTMKTFFFFFLIEVIYLFFDFKEKS